jgi:hypothetical protein
LRLNRALAGHYDLPTGSKAEGLITEIKTPMSPTSDVRRQQIYRGARVGNRWQVASLAFRA